MHVPGIPKRPGWLECSAWGYERETGSVNSKWFFNLIRSETGCQCLGDHSISVIHLLLLCNKWPQTHRLKTIYLLLLCFLILVIYNKAFNYLKVSRCQEPRHILTGASAQVLSSQGCYQGVREPALERLHEGWICFQAHLGHWQNSFPCSWRTEVLTSCWQRAGGHLQLPAMWPSPKAVHSMAICQRGNLSPVCSNGVLHNQTTLGKNPITLGPTG